VSSELHRRTMHVRRRAHTDFDTDCHFTDRAIDDRLAHMDTAALEDHLARKHDDLTCAFVQCPSWTTELLPRLMIVALRLELARGVRRQLNHKES
jgi:hypothetical protein